MVAQSRFKTITKPAIPQSSNLNFISYNLPSGRLGWNNKEELTYEINQGIDMDFPEAISLIAGVIGSLFGAFVFIYKKGLKPLVRFVKKVSGVVEDHNRLANNIDIIKKEITPNGGASLKDQITRIEKRQLVIDERSKAVFYNNDQIIFEIDNQGNIQWGNKAFHKMVGNKNVKGLDWVSLIDEPERQGFLSELSSCCDTGRELNFEVHTTEEKEVIMYGFPFKDEKSDVNYGFLIYILS